MRVLVGVGGGIAAYKSAELVRELQRLGHEVQVVMTGAAQEFVRPLTFAALTGKKVITGLFSDGNAQETLSSAVEHIAVAQEHELLVVAPATADLLGKFAHGLADDFLSTLYLAFEGGVVLAPAMNTVMWNHPAVRQNVETLRQRGCMIVEPGEGWLACGTVGAGRLADPAVIAQAVSTYTQRQADLRGEVMLVTAGPTREALDPVRFLSNRSSGKMGYAIASAAARRGAEVVLVSGPVALQPPAGVRVVQVQSALEMRQAVLDNLAAATIVIKSAAVADYYLADVPAGKRKKTGGRLTLELEATPDILAELGQRKGNRLLVGFAAETGNLLEEAQRKMAAKNCDMLVANLVNNAGLGFDSDRNEVDILLPEGLPVHAGPAEKTVIAEAILDQISALRARLHAASQ